MQGFSYSLNVIGLIYEKIEIMMAILFANIVILIGKRNKILLMLGGWFRIRPFHFLISFDTIPLFLEIKACDYVIPCFISFPFQP
jgi:hypothetical protein